MSQFKLFDSVYIKPTNAVGMIIWIPEGDNKHDEYRTDMDGMQCGVDLEPLTLEHLKIPGIKVLTPHIYVARYYKDEVGDIGPMERREFILRLL